MWMLDRPTFEWQATDRKSISSSKIAILFCFYSEARTLLLIEMYLQACGQYLKEINCNKSLTNDIIDKYIKGLASSGSWVLFDKVEQLCPSEGF